MPEFNPSTQADETVLSLTPKDTGLSSAQIRQAWSAKVKDAALFSARTTVDSYLKTLRGMIGDVAGGNVTPQVAETKLKKALQSLGYRPETGFAGHEGEVPPATPGSITDLSSSRRIELILDTNVKQARSLAQIAGSADPMAAYMRPAWKLTRTGARKKPRGDWRRRWAAAGAACGWQGAAKQVFVALKTSPIWAKIGEGAGGFGDTVGTPYPPFTPVKREVAYHIKGGLMNREYGLTGDNAYQDDLSILYFRLDDMENPNALAIPRFAVGGRWFDDVVDNNARREKAGR